MSDHRQPLEAIVALARDVGLEPVAAARPLPGTGNNRAYRLETRTRPLFAKVFFRDRHDRRDRLGAEVAFARFAWRHGVRALAEPIAADEEAGVALFGFIEGRRLRADEMAASHVDEASAFVEALNQDRDATDARELGDAAEACFSIADHLALVERRLVRLDTVEAGSPVDDRVVAFVAERLRPAWTAVRQRVVDAAATAMLDLNRTLPAPERCLSPSDFGFHNAIVTRIGDRERLVFHDFEYAGWDDPAKLVGDFFCQPELPVPAALAAAFRERVAAGLGLDDPARRRIALLEPVFRVKWCCIILNEFLASGRRRRRFASGRPLGEQRKHEQLAKAERALAALERS